MIKRNYEKERIIQGLKNMNVNWEKVTKLNEGKYDVPVDKLYQYLKDYDFIRFVPEKEVFIKIATANNTKMPGLEYLNPEAVYNILKKPVNKKSESEPVITTLTAEDIASKMKDFKLTYKGNFTYKLHEKNTSRVVRNYETYYPNHEEVVKILQKALSNKPISNMGQFIKAINEQGALDWLIEYSYIYNHLYEKNINVGFGGKRKTRKAKKARKHKKGTRKH